MNLPKEMKDTVLKDIKQDIDKYRDILCSWIGRLNVYKKSVISRLKNSS